MRTGLLIAAWVSTRAWLVWLLLGPQEWVFGDAAYFDISINAVPDVGLEATLTEYPLPAVPVVAVPWLAARVLGVDYGPMLMTAAVLTDLTFAVLLARLGRSRLAVWGWVVAIPLLGTTSFARFDLLPGILCGVAVLLMVGHPRVAAACAAVATAVKLWPVLVLPGLLAVARPRRGATVVVLAVGGALALGSVAAAGWARLFSPLSFQAERGLQIESVAATPAMLAWWLVPERWQVAYVQASHAYEIDGAGVGLLVTVSTLATLVYVVLLAAACWWLWRFRDRVGPGLAVWFMLAAVTGFTVVGKVLSPQYLIWLLPIALAGLAVADSRVLRSWVAGLLVAAGLTHAVFPVGYIEITTRTDQVWLPVLLLAVRNVVMVWLLGVAASSVWREMRLAQRGMALERQPPGPEGNDGRTFR